MSTENLPGRLLGVLAACPFVVYSGASWAQETGGTGAQGLEEVMVTAERRLETVQTTAIPVTVLSGEDLANQGVSQPEDLNKLVAGVNFTNNANTQVYIRGVGDSALFGQLEVSINTDGVVIGEPSEVAGNFYDLQRVEVLKGPQGTLYGRNSDAGAINLITNKPTQTFGGYVQEEIGDFNLRRTTGAINLPITTDLAVRFAFYDSKRDGYLSDGFDDEDTRAARMHVLWTPNSDVSLLVTVDASRVGGTGQGNAFVGIGLTGTQSSPLANQYHQLAVVPSTAGDEPIPLLAPSFQDYENRSARAQLDWNLGFATLTAISGYRTQTFDYDQVQINGSNATNGSAHQFNTELRLSNQTERLKWSAGLYYITDTYEENLHGQYVFFSLPPFNAFATVNNYFQVPDLGTQSEAAFGQATFSLTDRFRVVGGARYTDETRTADLAAQWYGEGYDIPGVSTLAINPMTGLQTNLYSYGYDKRLHAVDTSGKIGVEYDLRPKSLLYATISQGFKSGGFALSPPPQSTYLPEYLTAYTLGLKNRFFHDTVELNGELFYWDYTNQQITVTAPDINGAEGLITLNAGKSDLRGAELNFLWAPQASDRIGLQAQYEEATFQQFGAVTGFSSTSNGCSYKPTTYLGHAAYIENCVGLDLPLTPRWTGNADYSHTIGVRSGGDVVLAADVHFASSQQTTISNNSDFTEHGYGIFDASAAYESPRRAWSFAAYIRNINNKLVYTNLNSIGFSPFLPPNLYNSTILPPRTFGVRLNVTF